MSRTHIELTNLIWSIRNLLRGPYKSNEYCKASLSLTELQHFDCIFADNAVYTGDRANRRSATTVLKQEGVPTLRFHFSKVRCTTNPERGFAFSLSVAP